MVFCFGRAGTRDTTSRPVLCAPHAGSMTNLKTAIRSGLDWQYKCSNLDRDTPHTTPVPPAPRSGVHPKGAGALAGVLRGNRGVEGESKLMRRDWGAGSDGSASSTSSVSLDDPSGPYAPISYALKNYREEYRERQSNRAGKRNESPYCFPTKDSVSSGSSKACTQHCAGCALSLGVNPVKKVTWDDVIRTERVVVANRVTWSPWIQVFRIENVLDTGTEHL